MLLTNWARDWESGIINCKQICEFMKVVITVGGGLLAKVLLQQLNFSFPGSSLQPLQGFCKFLECVWNELNMLDMCMAKIRFPVTPPM